MDENVSVGSSACTEAAYEPAPNLKSDLGDLLLAQVSPALKSRMINDPVDSAGELVTVASCDQTENSLAAATYQQKKGRNMLHVEEG